MSLLDTHKKYNTLTKDAFKGDKGFLVALDKVS